MSFPANPTNNQQSVINGITYIFDATARTWTRTSSPISNVSILSNLTVANANVTNNLKANLAVLSNVYIADGLYWAGNGVSISSGGSGADEVLRANVGAYQTWANATFATTGGPSTSEIAANLGAYQLYANANIGTLFLGNASTQANIGAFYNYANANIGTLYLDNVSTQANIGAFQTYSNANAATQATSIDTINANIGAFYTYANTKIGTNNNGNLVIAATTTSTNSTTGALVVAGGIGVAGNVVADKFYTTNGLYWAGNGVAFSSGGSGTPAGSNQQIQYNNGGAFGASSGLIYDGVSLKVNGNLESTYHNGDEGGEIFLQKPDTNTTLSAGVTIDVFQNKLRFFENGGTNRGFYLDITSGGATVGTNIMSGSGSGSPSGSTGDVQFNNGGAFGATSLFYDSASGNLVITDTTNSTSTTTGALVVKGGVGIAASLYIANAGDVSANIGTLFLDNAATQANIGTLFLGNAATQANIGTLFLGNASTQANIGTITTNLNALDANVGAFETYANTKIGNNSNSNLVVVATTTSTSTTTGALVVKGGVGIAGDVYATSISVAPDTTLADALNLNNNNLYGVNTIRIYDPGTSEGITWEGGSGWYIYESPDDLSNDIGNLQIVRNGVRTLTVDTYGGVNVPNTKAATSTTTGALTVGGGVGVAGNVYADTLYTTTGIKWAGNGAVFSSGSGGSTFTYTSDIAPPGSPALGDQWYDTSTDVLYEYIEDGTTSYWVDIQSPTIFNDGAPNFSTAGNLTVGGNVSITGDLTFSGTFFGGAIGYMFEMANVVAAAPPATTDINIATSSILYYTSNATTNITANIRANATTPLNNILGTGQSLTVALMVPQATAYYVSTVKIDNSTITPVWQGGTTVSAGNANSIDIYTFTVIKTANATFKVFASQTKYQHTG